MNYAYEGEQIRKIGKEMIPGEVFENKQFSVKYIGKYLRERLLTYEYMSK